MRRITSRYVKRCHISLFPLFQISNSFKKPTELRPIDAMRQVLGLLDKLTGLEKKLRQVLGLLAKLTGLENMRQVLGLLAKLTGLEKLRQVLGLLAKLTGLEK